MAVGRERKEQWVDTELRHIKMFSAMLSVKDTVCLEDNRKTIKAAHKRKHTKQFTLFLALKISSFVFAIYDMAQTHAY